MFFEMRMEIPAQSLDAMSQLVLLRATYGSAPHSRHNSQALAVHLSLICMLRKLGSPDEDDWIHQMLMHYRSLP